MRHLKATTEEGDNILFPWSPNYHLVQATRLEFEPLLLGALLLFAPFGL